MRDRSGCGVVSGPADAEQSDWVRCPWPGTPVVGGPCRLRVGYGRLSEGRGGGRCNESDGKGRVRGRERAVHAHRRATVVARTGDGRMLSGIRRRVHGGHRCHARHGGGHGHRAGVSGAPHQVGAGQYYTGQEGRDGRPMASGRADEHDRDSTQPPPAGRPPASPQRGQGVRRPMPGRNRPDRAVWSVCARRRDGGEAGLLHDPHLRLEGAPGQLQGGVRTPPRARASAAPPSAPIQANQHARSISAHSDASGTATAAQCPHSRAACRRSCCSGVTSLIHVHQAVAAVSAHFRYGLTRSGKGKGEANPGSTNRKASTGQTAQIPHASRYRRRSPPQNSPWQIYGMALRCGIGRREYAVWRVVCRGPAGGSGPCGCMEAVDGGVEEVDGVRRSDTSGPGAAKETPSPSRCAGRAKAADGVRSYGWVSALGGLVGYQA